MRLDRRLDSRQARHGGSQLVPRSGECGAAVLYGASDTGLSPTPFRLATAPDPLAADRCSIVRGCAPPVIWRLVRALSRWDDKEQSPFCCGFVEAGRAGAADQRVGSATKARGSARSTELTQERGSTLGPELPRHVAGCHQRLSRERATVADGWLARPTGGLSSNPATAGRGPPTSSAQWQRGHASPTAHNNIAGTTVLHTEHRTCTRSIISPSPTSTNEQLQPRHAAQNTPGDRPSWI